MIFHLDFVHSYLSYVTLFFIIKLFRLDLETLSRCDEPLKLQDVLCHIHDEIETPTK